MIVNHGLPSGNFLHRDMEHCPVQIVDLPSYNMVDLSIVFWDCLPGRVWSLKNYYPHPLVHWRMDGTWWNWARRIHRFKLRSRWCCEVFLYHMIVAPWRNGDQDAYIDLWWSILKTWGFDDIWWLLGGSRNGHLHHLNHLRLANLAMILILNLTTGWITSRCLTINHEQVQIWVWVTLWLFNIAMERSTHL